MQSLLSREFPYGTFRRRVSQRMNAKKRFRTVRQDALHNKDDRIRGVQGTGLEKKKQDVANRIGRGSEIGGGPPFETVEFLNRYQKAADDHIV